MRLFTFIFILFFLLHTPVTSFADKASSFNKKGIESFNRKEYQRSTKHFTDALVERPDSPEIKFNLGTALSEQKENEEALRQLDAAAQGLKTKNQQAAAHFNAGNALFVSGNFEKSIEEYKNAVKLDQSSGDIRHNLEIAVRRLQQQKQQKQDKEEQKDGEKKEQNEDQQQDSGKEDKEEEKEQKKDDQESKTKNANDKQQQDKQQQQSNQKQNENQPMTKEEAQQLLDAIKDDEKKALQLRKMQFQSEMRQGDDW